MVSEVRLALCGAAEKEASAHWIKVAPGRSLHQDEWRPTLFMASRGSKRSGHRYFGSAKERSLGSASLLSQAAACGKGTPRVIITDKLRSYAAARKLIMPDIEHRQSRYLNNRAENSHQPTRIRERQMKRFKSSEQAQRFLSLFESINAPFRSRRHLLSATRYRLLLNQSFHLWNKAALASLVS